MTIDIPLPRLPRAFSNRYRLERCSRGYHWCNVRTSDVLSLGGAVEACQPSVYTASRAMLEMYGRRVTFPGVQRIVPLWILRAVHGFTWYHCGPWAIGVPHCHTNAVIRYHADGRQWLDSPATLREWCNYRHDRRLRHVARRAVRERFCVG
jgi:hypothetical protein